MVLTDDAAYFTDTLNPTLWRVPITETKVGELEPWLDLTTTVLQYAEGANLNGITATPYGRSLIVGQMNRGLLFRIDLAERKAVPIEIDSESLIGIDRLVLDGQRLYMVRQPVEEIVTVEVSEDFSSGQVVGRFKSSDLDWPATAAKAGDRLLVVNSQFDKRRSEDPTLPFEVIGIPISLLAKSGGAQR